MGKYAGDFGRCEAIDLPDENAEWEDAAFYNNMARAGDWIHSRCKPDNVFVTKDADILLEIMFFIEEECADYVRGIELLPDEIFAHFKDSYKSVRAFAPIAGEPPL